MKFTDRYIQSLKPREKEYCIRESYGFTIRVLPTGCKTFQYIYTLAGKRRRFNLGHYPATTLAVAPKKFRAAANQELSSSLVYETEPAWLIRRRAAATVSAFFPSRVRRP
ncbi:MAG: hypothetical protein Fur0034_11320 [Desulfuromonadia bacterium]